ncbi:MAG: tRNA 2-thiouridine(34) synthase MnmA [Clostridia bacterium]|nr:tRNA 2-thiouridine(34) synthase MnmA [Clostridia bacterium]
MKALIAMSGGVDSSVAAYLTKEQGLECIGCTMKLFESEDAGFSSSKVCCSLDSVEDARSVAFRIGIPFYVFNYKDEFRQKVIGKFADEYMRGLTPNPCIECNTHLKFGKLVQRAKELGCSYVVTGHYARVTFDGKKYHLLRGLDPSKDQSYVLYTLTQEQLSMLRLPLGGYSKDEVRRIAAQQGFVNADRPDSQDICFVPDGDYAAAIERITGEAPKPGDFVDSQGKVLGKHKGIIRYTVGQRKGLGIAFGEPVFVIKTDPKTNTVVLGKNEDLFYRHVKVRDVNWISGETPQAPVNVQAKLRYRQQAADALLIPEGKDRAELVFDQPQRAPAPGQAAVFYDGDEVLGGGIIEHAF